MESFRGSDGDGQQHGSCEAFVTILYRLDRCLVILGKTIALRKFVQSMGGVLQATENRGAA